METSKHERAIVTATDGDHYVTQEDLTSWQQITKAEMDDLRQQLAAKDAEIERLKQEKSDDELAFNHANEVIGKYMETEARLQSQLAASERKVGEAEKLLNNALLELQQFGLAVLPKEIRAFLAARKEGQ